MGSNPPEYILPLWWNLVDISDSKSDAERHPGSIPGKGTMKKTEAWWVCTVCKGKLARVGKQGLMGEIRVHREAACGPLAGASIKQVAQQNAR